MDIFGSKKIFKRQCECDRNRLKKEAERKKRQEIEDLKKRCFNSMNQWAYTFDNYQGGKEQCFTVAKNFVKEYETMKKRISDFYSLEQSVVEKTTLLVQ